MNQIAGIWNAALVTIAALDFASGGGKLGATIMASMVITAVLTGIASSMAEGIVEALPFLTGGVGTISMVIYWVLRIDVWLGSVGGGT